MRLRKCPSESTLLLTDFSVHGLQDPQLDHGGISGTKKRLASQHSENSRRIGKDSFGRESGDSWGSRQGKSLQQPARQSTGSATAPLTSSMGPVPACLQTSSGDLPEHDTGTDRSANVSAFQNPGTADLGVPAPVGAGEENEREVSGSWSSMDYGESDRFDLPSDNRATLTRIGSQLTLTLPPTMGISQRKRLLTSLSERVDAHEAIILHNHSGVSFGSASPSQFSCQASPQSWRRSFSSTTAELQDLANFPSSRRSSEDDAKSKPAASSSCDSINGMCPKSQQNAELCLRLNHARQTMSFVHSQVAKYTKLDKAELSVWAALDMLGDLSECETTFLESPETDADVPLIDHCYLTAESCRLAYPEYDWLAVVGLIHLLGRLLLHNRIGGEPAWAVCGESYPVGCRFDPAIHYHHYFSVNPDKRRKQYNSPLGIYSQGKGLASVYMSWSASEYLYMLLLLNKSSLPPEALFLIRYQRFLSLESSKSYKSLMNAQDLEMLPWLEKFRELSIHRKRDVPGALRGENFRKHYSKLLEKYIPNGMLKF